MFPRSLSFRSLVLVSQALGMAGLWLALSWFSLGQLRQTFKRQEASEAALWLQRTGRALRPLVVTGRLDEAKRLAQGLARQNPHYRLEDLRLFTQPRSPATVPRQRTRFKPHHTLVSVPLVYQQQIQEEASQAVQTGGILTFRESIRFEDRVYGQWTLLVRDSAFAPELGAIRQRFLGAGLGLLLLFFGATLLLSGRLTRPVEELIRLGQRVAEDQLDQEATPGGPAELRTAIDSANRMMRALQKRKAEQQQRLEAVSALQQETARLAQMQASFTAAVSHELKTPLVAIEGYSRLLADKLTGQDGADAANVLSSALHLKSLINTLLDTVRLSQGELALFPRPTDVASVVRDFHRVIDYSLARSHSAFTEDLAPPPHRVLMDPDRLLQIILNLVGNALKHAQGAPVCWRLWAEGEELVIDVTDEGPGIAPEHREEIFAPFVRLDQALGKAEGTGLGLFIVRSLARNMGGDVTVSEHPDPGKTGVRFVVRVAAPAVRP